MPGAWELLSETGDIPGLLIPAPAVSKNAQAEISSCLGSRIHFRDSPVGLRSFDMPFSSFVDFDCLDKKFNHFSILLNHSRSHGRTAHARRPCLNCTMKDQVFSTTIKIQCEEQNYSYYNKQSCLYSDLCSVTCVHSCYVNLKMLFTNITHKLIPMNFTYIFYVIFITDLNVMNVHKSLLCLSRQFMWSKIW